MSFLSTVLICMQLPVNLNPNSSKHKVTYLKKNYVLKHLLHVRIGLEKATLRTIILLTCVENSETCYMFKLQEVKFDTIHSIVPQIFVY